MSLQQFHTNLKALLLADAGLDGWGTTHFGKQPVAVDGNTPVATIRPDEMPVMIFELGDGRGSLHRDSDDLYDADDELKLAICWHEKDPAKAFTQRVTLPKLVIKALMADPQLAGAVTDAEVANWQSNQAVNHPVHVMWFTIKARYSIE